MGKMGDGKHQKKLLCNQLMWNETLGQSQDTWVQVLAPPVYFSSPLQLY